jgi:hypothetical protein
LFVAPNRDKPKMGNEKPFDISEYAKAIASLTEALKEANALVANGGSLLASPRFDQVTTKQVANAGAQGERIVDAAFWRGVALIVTFFIMLTLYRAFSHWLRGRDIRRAVRTP